MYKKLVAENYYQFNWLKKYIEDTKGIIAGGCFKNILNKEKVKDIDIFFNSLEDWENARNYFCSKTAGYTEFPDDEAVTEDEATFEFNYENKNVIAFKDKSNGVIIELCRKIFGTPEEILNQFDFTIVKMALYNGIELITNEDGFEDAVVVTKLICDEDFYEHLFLKRLVINDKIPYPASTFERMIKYVKYGYIPCRETKMKLLQALNELPEEALILSDSLYDGVD